MKRRCNYCGGTENVPLLKFRLFLFGKVYHRCRYCGKVSSYIMCSHIVHDTLDIKEKLENKRLEESKTKLWRRIK